MSIVLIKDGVGWIYAKGADNIMLELAREDTDTITLNQHLYHFSTQGLRTLVVARKQLSETELDRFRMRYNDAKNAIANR